ncbi:MAG: GxxExxY protein [Armatimonadota bacterium]
MEHSEPIRKRTVTFEPVSQRVIGAAIAVLKAVGPGFREEVYENALCIELESRGIPYERQVQVPVFYRRRNVGTHILDLLVDKTVVIELKAVSSLANLHAAQAVSYLRAANLRVGLVLNFGETPLGIRRVVNRYEPTS